jgi:Lon protease-like protein
MVAVGARRLRVVEWQPDDPYPIADVEDWPDTPVDDPAAMRGVVDALATRVAEVQRLAQEVAQASKQRAAAPSVSAPKLGDDLAMATYQLVTRAPIGPADRYRLLSAPSISVRLDTFSEVLDDVQAMLRFRLETSG